MKLRYKKKIAALRSRLSASRGYGVSGLMLIGGERSRVDLLDFAIAIHDNQARQDQRIYKLEYERFAAAIRAQKLRDFKLRKQFRFADFANSCKFTSLPTYDEWDAFQSKAEKQP